MVPSLVSLSARAVISDHCLLATWLNCIPCELYRPLLDAAFTLCNHLAIGELVQRWPQKTLCIRWQRSRDHESPNHRCVVALLLAVVRGLTDKRCCLKVLELCRLQCENSNWEDSIGGRSLTVALCSMLLQTRNITVAFKGCQRDERDKKKRATESVGAVKRDRAGLKKEEAKKIDCSDNAVCEQDNTNSVRRKMDLQKRTGFEPEQVYSREGVLLDIRADLFVNSRSWNRVCRALRLSGPLRLHCRFLRVEDLPASSIVSLLHLIPQEELLGLDVRYSGMGVSGLVLLLPQLALFPQLCSLRLHYCNLDNMRFWPGHQVAPQDLSRGFRELKSLRRLSLTGLHLPGLLRLLLSSLSEPLEVLKLPDLCLTASDMAYLSRSPHASSLAKLDLSDNELDEQTLHSLRYLLTQADCSLKHLSLCGCGLSDGSLGALLPSLGQCCALRSLHLALNPLSRAALVRLVQVAAGIQSLRFLLYPKPLEEYQPGLPALPSRTQLLNWPLIKDSEATLTQLGEVLRAKGRTQDLLLTPNLWKYGSDHQ